MYRYLLFQYDLYYPCGGMEDCVLKTNNFDELEKFIHANYEDDYFQGTISYYDTFEDKTWYADMEEYQNEDYFTRWRFVGWDKQCDEEIEYDTLQDTTLDYNKYFRELECAMNQVDHIDRREHTYVKITTQFHNYLKKLYGLDLSHQVLNVLSSFLGVITTIDDTISHPCYEIVSLAEEENTK